MFKLCPPALIYLIFSLTQIIIDLFKGLFNTAFVKVLVAAMITFLLNTLCNQGLTVISWIIVFIPFILMTTIVTVILYVFGLDIATGKLSKQSCSPVSASPSPSPSPSPQVTSYCPPHGISETACIVETTTSPTATTANMIPPPYGSSSTAYES
jgi:hypothetical protein